MDTLISAPEALARLIEGNIRFVSRVRRVSALTSPVPGLELTAEQKPFAVILGCSDSRVPPETIFDQGLGDLFVVRVAGNVVAPPQVGSIEFAVEQLGTRLVIVLGHTTCGAVLTTLEAMAGSTRELSPNLLSIVDCIRPSIEPLLKPGIRRKPGELEQQAVRENIRTAVDHLRHASPVLNRSIREHGLLVVGAEYSLKTGEVHFFDGTAVDGW